MSRKSSKPFWAKNYKKAAYNRQYYFKKKMQDKFASVAIMFFGGAVIFGWLFPSHDHAHKSNITSISPKSAYAANSYLNDTSSSNATYRPDFNCSSDHSKDSIATMLCQNSEAAKHELIFDQTYYALRQVVGKDGWKALKQEVGADDTILKECLDSSKSTSPQNIPQADPVCYITHMDALTDKYKSRLYGPSLEEASRPIEQHIALQNDLIALGFLGGNAQADGVYGESTRAAIIKWQKSHGDSDVTGFISDDDADKLSQEVEKIAPSGGNLQSSGVAFSAPEPASNSSTHNDDSQSGSNFPYYLALFAAICAALYVFVKSMQKKAYQATWDSVSKEIFSQKLNLQIARTQKLTTDQYGTLQTAAWVREINYFMETRIEGIIISGINNPTLRQKLRLNAINLITEVASDPLPVNTGSTAYVSNPSVFDTRMSPFDYEQHCALILSNAGWDAHATQKSGDQGADVIARKGNVRIVVQCKLYSGTVGNDAVQQAFAAQNFQGANGAIVATNSTFSQSARQVAATTGVILVHHTQLPTAAEEIYNRTNDQPILSTLL
ncbi:MAG: restriction endonuclease [Acetobacter fabarum]|jgi:restriction system protein|uniref:restriction endonuclease n=1 Tax=Acetobacter fabarum TaxID=483199 RepID=UPI0024303E5F|nr:restriction endonuclease [Acetobacter fabarum]MCH4026207.1 restriction endonuclease [Acetobacter fabarum]MCH4054956.1 restriction endonuclease [Acetobacter fabarum]MCH4085931.1 restriction endonuclease [Acetobacter fabarum]MCH4127477.1 restriction endonuclease [Acetobacter fabarum]MCH4136826.1 restriction endonuclease [Acetobacter fabarum]